MKGKKTMKMTNFRWKVAWLIFAISFVSYMDRVNLSVATPVIMKEFGFTKIDMGLIQSFFFAGYALMQVPGGMLAEKFGHRFTGSIACGWWSVFTALTAVASGKYTFAIVRLMFGLGEAPIYPAFAMAEHKWFNKDEKGKASSFILNGCFFGPVVGPAVVVWLMTTFGWHHVFLSFGVVGLLLAWAWHKYVTDDPKDSPYVNEAELAHINEGRVEATGEKQIAPWGKLLRSTQFWALGIQFLITDYIMYVFLAWLPMYLMEVHKFSLAKMGIWAAAPWISLMAVVTLCGHYSDKLLRSGMSQNMVKTATGAAGILLCAIVAAIMSSSDSQMLVTASAISNDIYKTIFRKEATDKELLRVSKIAVIAVAVIAFVLALNPDNSVMNLVSYSWAGLGAAFGPAMILSLYWKRMTMKGALAGMVSGGLGVLFWNTCLTESSPIFGDRFVICDTGLYELVPAFILSIIVIVVVSLIDKKPSQQVYDEFNRVCTEKFD